MSKMGQELERKLDENKYRLLEVVKKTLQELRTYIEGEVCDHDVGICYCDTFICMDEADKVIADIEGGKTNG